MKADVVRKTIPGPDGRPLDVVERRDIRGMSHLFELRQPKSQPRFFRLGPEEHRAGKAREVTEEVTDLLLARLARSAFAAAGQRRMTRRRLQHARHNSPAEWQRRNDQVLRQREEVPETGQMRERRLRTDVVDRLHRRGALSLEQLQAAEDLRAAWASLTRGLFMSARRLDARQVDGGGGFRDPVDRMRARDLARMKRYRPWASATGAVHVAARHTPGLTLLQLAIDMLVDNLGPTQVERRHGLRNGTATGWLRRALDMY